jgi:patatin-like phospholipase/acyl hydrolase
MAETYRVLSFDGGGLKGLITIGMIERIGDALKKPGWYQEASFYAGTSTGGLIALGLAAGIDLSTLKKMYVEQGANIFNRKAVYYKSSLCRFFHAGYKHDELETQLIDVYQDRRLSDLKKRALVVSYDLYSEGKQANKSGGERREWRPKIIHNFSGHANDLSLVEAGLATSAAPTYLPSFGHFVDGGVCANNPSVCALTQLMDERNADRGDKPSLQSVSLMSFGTGENPTPIKKTDITWGILGWNTKILSLLMEGGVGIADYQCRQLLRESYRRADIKLDESIEMDDASKIPDMEKIVADIPQKTIDSWAEWLQSNWLKG